MSVGKTPVYNLKVILKETGISADTLRAWERRYGLPKPQRSPGGHRLYSQHDIEMVRWLIARQAEGLSISRAIDLWNEHTTQGLDPLTAAPATAAVATSPRSVSLPGLFPADFGLQTMCSQWVSACLAFNETVAEQVLNQAFAMHPVETVCLDLLQKGLAEIGERWYTGQASVQHEHFASSLALRRLDALIAAAPAPTRAQMVMIACPPDEWHTFSPLILTLFLRRRGLQVTYLGANVPLSRFDETIQQVRPDVLVLSAQRLHTAHTLQEIAAPLTGSNLRVGYGGRIFNFLPAIQAHIPAFFLGADIQSAIESVEQLLKHDAPVAPAEKIPEETLSVRQHFQNARLSIENSLAAKIAGSGLPVEHISTANSFMAENLSAALALGDACLLSVEIDWVNGYLGNARLEPAFLPAYLSLYAYTVKDILGAEGNLIVSCLNKLVETLETGSSETILLEK